MNIENIPDAIAALIETTKQGIPPNKRDDLTLDVIGFLRRFFEAAQVQATFAKAAQEHFAIEFPSGDAPPSQEELDAYAFAKKTSARRLLPLLDAQEAALEGLGSPSERAAALEQLRDARAHFEKEAGIVKRSDAELLQLGEALADLDAVTSAPAEDLPLVGWRISYYDPNAADLTWMPPKAEQAFTEEESALKVRADKLFGQIKGVDAAYDQLRALRSRCAHSVRTRDSLDVCAVCGEQLADNMRWASALHGGHVRRDGDDDGGGYVSDSDDDAPGGILDGPIFEGDADSEDSEDDGSENGGIFR